MVLYKKNSRWRNIVVTKIKLLQKIIIKQIMDVREKIIKYEYMINYSEANVL